MIEFGHASHTGLQRTHNEDTYWADHDLGLFVVAGGVGGPGRGEIASAIACQTLVDAIGHGHDLAAAVIAADASIAAHAPTHGRPGPMGTALAVLRIAGEQYAAAAVGDSHVLRLHNGYLHPIDQANEEAAKTSVDGSSDDPATGVARRHRATQALGITPPRKLCVRPVTGALEPGTQFLVCSDGLTDELDDTQIAAILMRTDLAAQECVDQLLLAALDAGGRDNITAIVVRAL